MLHSPGGPCGNRQGGQALLVAVLLMMVILLTGILFVSIVSYNQQQSLRSTDVVTAQSLAEAGIRWCNENLVRSPQGADWRPPYRPLVLTGPNAYDPAHRDTWPLPPVMGTDGTDFGTYGPDGVEDSGDDYYSDFERARGWHGLVDPNTGQYIRHGFYRIPDPNSAPEAVPLPAELASIGGRGHILVRVTYDPDPPFELNADGTPAQQNEMSGQIKIESIGVLDQDVTVYRYLVAYKPLGLTDYVLWVTDKNRSGRPTKLGYPSLLDLENDGGATLLGQLFMGPLKFNNRVELPQGASNAIVLTPQPTVAVREVPSPTNSMVVTGGYLRADRLEAQGITESATTPGLTTLGLRDQNGNVSPRGALLPSSSPSFDSLQGLVLDGQQSLDVAGYSRACTPLSAPEAFSQSGLARYRTLTRESGEVVTLASGETVNTGRYGFGRGIYVDNRSDLQYVGPDGSHDLDALIAEWMQAFPDDFARENSGWNPPCTTYTAPGVEITLFPTEAAALDFGRLTLSPTPSNQPQTVWWPGHVAGEPGLRLTRSDHTWRWYNPNTGAIEDSGETTLYLDYPSYPNQVVFAEGNVRVHGVMPRNDANQVTRTLRDYNLTIVSGGTIYIDGQILSPQDVFGRDPGSGNVPAPNGPCPDEYNNKVALLARDCVCLNPTRIVPQLTSGQVAVAADDPANPGGDRQHWVLTPDVQGAAYSTWSWGEATSSATIRLSALHTAADPGPAAISLSIFNAGNGTMTAYDFDPGNQVQNKFYFVQPGVEVQPGVTAADWIENLLAPSWGRLWSVSNPRVPWDLRGYVNDGAGPAPGVLKSVAISAVDPAIPNQGGGATEYWLKKWKIQEFDANNEPVASIHAKVNALIYAENGCWFVIPGSYFDPTQSGAMARSFRRYNYDICVRGMITECFHAEPEMVREWCDKWAFPIPNGGWGTIRYEYDESLRTVRDQTLSTLVGATRACPAPSSTIQANLPKLPLLPMSKDLVFYGEGI